MPTFAPELRRELLWMTAIGGGLLLATALTLVALESLAYALRWMAGSVVCWGIVIWQCRRRLPLNRRTAEDACHDTLGPGNRVTLLRGALIAATAGFLTAGGPGLHSFTPFLVALCYTVAIAGDWLDGHLARRQQRITLLGEELDMALDALGLLVAPLVAILYGKLHISYLLVSVAYYLFQWGLYWRRRQNRPIYPLPPSRRRRFLAGVQMLVVAAALWPPLPADATRISGVILMLPLLAGFWLDWLSVSGLQRPKDWR